MKFVGAHVSASGGVFNAPKNAVEIGAKAFALFTKNQRQWSAKALDNKTIDLWFKELEKSKIESAAFQPKSEIFYIFAAIALFRDSFTTFKTFALS